MTPRDVGEGSGAELRTLLVTRAELQGPNGTSRLVWDVLAACRGSQGRGVPGAGRCWLLWGSLRVRQAAAPIPACQHLHVSCLDRYLLSQPFLLGEVLQSTQHPCGPALDSLQYGHISLGLGIPAPDTVLLPNKTFFHLCGRGLCLLGVVPENPVLSPESHGDPPSDIAPFEAWGSPEGPQCCP